jgi:hypothetical protein
MTELRHAAATGDHREQHRGHGGSTEPRAMRDLLDDAETFLPWTAGQPKAGMIGIA